MDKKKTYLDIDPRDIDVEETIKRFNHDPRKLSPWSSKFIVMICSVNGTLHETRRNVLNRSKSIRETGRYRSLQAVVTEYGQLVKGQPLPKSTCKAMAKSQKARREREKAERELDDKGPD